LTGQTRTQPPHPVQDVSVTEPMAPPPSLGRNRIACCSHASSQTRQVTPRVSMQLVLMCALIGHGSAFDVSKQSTGQLAVHEPQNVQEPMEKSTIG